MTNPRTLRIDLASAQPVYEQIASGLRALLVSGAFEPGEQLLTVRQLAIDLGVHHNTVAEAYRMLAEEGWLDLRRRRGAVVLDRLDPKATPEAKQDFRKHLEELIAKAIAHGVPRSTIANRMVDIAKKLVQGETR